MLITRGSGAPESIPATQTAAMAGCESDEHRPAPVRRTDPPPLGDKLAYLMDAVIVDVDKLTEATGDLAGAFAGRRLAPVVSPAVRLAVRLTTCVGILGIFPGIPLAAGVAGVVVIAPVLAAVEVSDGTLIAVIVSVGANVLLRGWKRKV